MHLTTMRLYIVSTLLLTAFAFTACNQYLDKYPDNRMELSSPEDASKLLVTAYPEGHPAYLLEMYSDNTDEHNYATWTAANRFQEQAYRWEDISEVRDQETPQQLWDAHYTAITTANEVIKHINSVSDKSAYSTQLAEAKLCRAYAMFQLANVFCQAYAPETAGKDLGLPYPEIPEDRPGITYQRGTLAELYAHIEKDITEGIPELGSRYVSPKFHFNVNAAHAFAARFYLYYRKFDKAVEHATRVLGSNPASVLRDWSAWSKLGLSGNIQPNDFVKSSNKANLFLQVIATEWGGISIPIAAGSKYAHGNLISDKETLQAPSPWAASGQEMNYVVVNNSGISKYALHKLPYTPKYIDRQAGIGIPYSQYPVFTTDETLLVRAEALALLGRYDEALADLNAELSVFTKRGVQITLDQIKTFYNGTAYYKPDAPTPKKELHTSITLDKVTQEPLLQCILQLRRVLTIHEGLRMQDVKRYGITIYRRRISSTGVLEQVTDQMQARDPRLAIQIPQDVISAGLTANPR